MTQIIELVDAQSQAVLVSLGNEVARGGAGTVYHIKSDSAHVIKIYHEATLQTDGILYKHRIEAMLRQPPALPPIDFNQQSYVQISWPLALARDPKSKKFLGFSMPVLDISRTEMLEWVLNEKQATKRGLRCDMAAKITLARQMSSVLSSLHDAKHYVIDLKPINTRFYKDVLYMAFLDCDGFSIADGKSRINAPQFTPDYVAPEFRGGAISPNTSPEQQDRFALAVVIFQLLNYGIHPYAGIPNNKAVPNEQPKKIEGNYYAYGQLAHQDIDPVAGSAHLSLPTDIRNLFDRAFGLNPAGRPSAREWCNTLDKYAIRSTNQLLRCKLDSSHFYFARMSCGACERARLKSNYLQPIKINTSAAIKPVIRQKHAPSANQTSIIPASQGAQLNPTPSTNNFIKNFGLLLVGVTAVVCLAYFANHWSYWQIIKATAVFYVIARIYFFIEDSANADGNILALVFALVFCVVVSGLKFGWHAFSDSQSKAVSEVQTAPSPETSANQTLPPMYLEDSLRDAEILREEELKNAESTLSEVEPDAIASLISAESLNLLASKGNKKAILAVALLDSSKGSDEAKRAFAKIKSQADRGFSLAQFFTSKMFYEGIGTDFDEAKGRAYLRKSANKGYSRAMYDLGSRLLVGNGVKENRNAAIKWLNLAKEAGSFEARNELDKISNQSLAQESTAVDSKSEEPVIRDNPSNSEYSSPGGYSPPIEPQSDNTSAGSGYETKFKGAFGITIEKRVYPTEEMKSNALELWKNERKVLELDGTINEEHVVKQPEFHPATGIRLR